MRKFILFFAVPALLHTGALRAEIVGAYQVNHRFDRPAGGESNPDINAAKAAQPDAGGTVYLYWRNTGDAPLQVDAVSWAGESFDHWAAEAGDYRAVWRSSRPETLEPGRIGEVAVALRQALPHDTEFTLTFSDGSAERVTVPAADPPVRFATVAFTEDFSRIRCFLESAPGVKVANLSCDGRPVRVEWWSEEFDRGLRAGEIVLDHPLSPGDRVVLLAHDAEGGVLAGTSLRAFTGLATFGTYGFGDLERYAENGLGSFNSFVKASPEALEQAEMLKLKIVSGDWQPSPDTAGHPALYAYLLLDEPDAHDYGQWPERPIGRRLGGNAPEMLRRYERVVAADPGKPALLTINLTFTPFNYFVYAPLADLANPDIYTNTCGWSVKYIDHHLAMVRQAAAPRPFAFTYQSCWEEWSTLTDGWAGKAEVLSKGFEHFRDPDKPPRGFGFNTDPDEIAIAMHYGLGNGAVALFAYTDATETGSGLLFHGTDVLPENWTAVGENSRKFRWLVPLLQPAHPASLAQAGGGVWVSTLLLDRDAALVVAVNENYRYEGAERRFRIEAAETEFSFPETPWFKPETLHRVTPAGFEELAMAEGRWGHAVANGEVYLVTSSPAKAAELIAEARDYVAGCEAALESAKGAKAERERLLARFRSEGRAVAAIPVNGYGITDAGFPPVPGTPYNGLEGWEAEGTLEIGAEWLIPIPSEACGQEARLLWDGQLYGAPAEVTLTAPDGGVVMNLRPDLSVRTERIWAFIPESAGEYRLRVTVRPEQPVEHGGRIASQLFVYTAGRM